MKRRWLLLVMAVLIAAQVTGCKEVVQIDEEHEVQIGRDAAQKLETQEGVWSNAAQTTRVRNIGTAIARNTPRPNLPWSFKILDDKQINAMALPGGYVYATRGLIESGIDDQKLAGVLGHEIAHVTQRHAVKIMEKALTGEMLVAIVTHDSSGEIQKAADIALELIVRRGYREEEYDADRVGTRWAHTSGYSADGMLGFLRDIKELEGRDPSQLETWISTHPPTSKRIARLEEFIPTLTGG
ncbi:MAG: M48 family metalloprotease [Armatimonadota bacterium]|nr:MAG: M48 family metalloprotease [Armatimonadota bacterium]